MICIVMDDIPIEIWKLIALNLKPGIMTRVSKMFNIYDETWYRDYLVMKYDENEIMNKTFSFKELCQRSLLEGSLYTCDSYGTIGINFEIKAVHAVPEDFSFKHQILKFNGDLLIMKKNKILQIIDYNVITLDLNCYIKKNELYFYDDDYKYKSIIFTPTESPILNIQYIQKIHLSIFCQFYTSNAIYFNYNDINDNFEIQKFNIKYQIIKTFTLMSQTAPKIYKYVTYILTINRTLLIYLNKNFIFEPTIIDNVDDIGPNYLYIDNKYYYIERSTWRFQDFNINNFLSIKTKTEPNPSYCYAKLEINKKIIWINYKGEILRSLQDTNIKKIFGTYHQFYVIEY